MPFSRSSLNHNDVFILDTASKIFLFSGCNSSIQERAKSLEVVDYIKETRHNGDCEVAAIGLYVPPVLFIYLLPLYNLRVIAEDGKFVGDPEVGEFWSLFGGYAPIPRDSPSFFQDQLDTQSTKLFW